MNNLTRSTTLTRANVVVLAAFTLDANPLARLVLTGCREACDAFAAEVLANLSEGRGGSAFTGRASKIDINEGPAEILGCALVSEFNGMHSALTLDFPLEPPPRGADAPVPVLALPMPSTSLQAVRRRRWALGWSLVVLVATCVLMSVAAFAVQDSGVEGTPVRYADSFAVAR